jgi:formamidopyrimidine-DNA glycosylase
MPELPDVEMARRLAERVARGRRIVDVEVAPDPLVYEGVTPRRIRQALVGRRVLGVGRHGKHFWLELDRPPWPVFHFGMTGGLYAPRQPRVHLVSEGGASSDDAWPPRFTKLVVTVEAGGQLAWADARRLGRIRLRQNPPTEPPVSRLGFDALEGLPSVRALARLLAQRAAPVKAVLLDQAFAAGVGNWIADEVLYQGGIAPRRPARSLSLAEVRRLRAALRRVVTIAVRREGDGDRFPRTWLFHVRWGRRRKDPRTRRGEPIRYVTIGGRTTAWVPGRQR